jgi:DNA/RNA endonuclease YhcR with UshA esterase domain
MKFALALLAGASSLLAAAPAVSHHAFAAEFDINKPVKLTGAITKIEWTNPHAWLFVAAKDEQGNVTNWAVELVGINDLLRLGWGRNRVQPGDVVSVDGFGARNGTNTANAASVSLANGELLWASQARDRQ